ncbi:NAD-dependent epimerase/dehydratase family protein [Nocardioides coralli]|uniref:NAD-dependent epimerase/dehydratase family protein n=1 Tax=Nocardioides coralli TaxID=2872154 RepID=UPI001CA43831|nr:NAD-dependent epimerase/dehydratase family protein [Nocardioides coralli]QZY30621.1 reductase [Nocardioides coralli]
MRVLVLGGSHHVGRAVVETALARGDDVVTLNRGLTGVTAPGVDVRHADRRDPGAVAAALGDDEFDAVVDTWSQEPVVVRDAARLLSGRAGHYTYVSSRSVYTWPPAPGLDESAPVVEGDPDGTDAGDYAAAKRGGELAAIRDFDGDVLLARAGLILGPWERVGRLPFWLDRVAAGGRVPTPGPEDRPLQLVDARDLAQWVLEHQPVGVFNTVSRPGHTTVGELLAECVRVTGSEAELVWLSPEAVERAGVAPWTELPIWVPPTGELAGLHDGDVSAAYAAGLTCRPVRETVAATWAWMQREGLPPQPGDRPRTGMDVAAERRLWKAAGQTA